MRLLLDVGNSRLKWAWLDDGRLHSPGAAIHGGRAASVDAVVAVGIPQEVLVASVAGPGFDAALSAELSRRWPVPLRFARTEIRGSGVRNGYSESAQMGVDRWLAMVAAWNRRHAAVWVADAGTAITIDLVQADGQHVGGLILPGRALMQQSLLAETGRIAASAALAAAADTGATDLGRDTEACIRAAARRAVAAVVRGCLEQSPATLIVTGGDAAALLADLPPGAEHRPLLVLEGLALRLAAAGDAELRA